MSKKVIAIALFAVMVLSLIPFANAAAGDFASLSGVRFGTTTNNWSNVDPAGGVLNVVSNPNATVTLTAKYADLSETAQSDWVSTKVAKQDFVLQFAGDQYDTITLTSSVNGAKTISLESGHTYAHTFIAKQGGNSETITVTTIKGGTTSVHTFTIKYVDKGDSAKTVQDLFVKVHNVDTTPITASTSNKEAGLYNAYVVGGVLFIDYYADATNGLPKNEGTNTNRTMLLGLSFYSDAAGSTRVPAKDRIAKVVWDSNTSIDKDAGEEHDAFFRYRDTAVISDSEIKNDSTYKIEVNTAKKNSFKIRIEDENYFYQSASIPVVWTAVPKNEITNVNISPSRNVTIAIGETVEFKVTPTHSTTLTSLSLEDSSATTNRAVYIDGLKVKGVAEGTAVLTVKSGTKPIDAITVTVVKEKTPDPVDNNQYRVIARKLNVRAGAGTNTAVVGSLSQNQIVEVVSIENGWAKLSNGNYVSAQYIVKIEAANGVGNHQVTASSLNVRASANGSKIGSVKKGTTVNVISIENGWAQISYGSGMGYVSTAYLKAL